MPIRFRCAYCNQLLGIAHRKAGTVVRCPTCAGQVVVPDPNAEGTEHNASNEPPQAPLFERSDFDELFNPGEKKAKLPEKPEKLMTAAPLPDVPSSADMPSLPAVPATRTRGGPPAGIDVVRVPGPVGATTPVFELSRRRMTWLTVAAVAALVLAFAAGLLLGLFLRQTSG
jgi:hypothetical protein